MHLNNQNSNFLFNFFLFLKKYFLYELARRPTGQPLCEAGQPHPLFANQLRCIPMHDEPTHIATPTHQDQRVKKQHNEIK